MKMVEITDKAWEFLFIQGLIYIIFFIINMILMKTKPEDWMNLGCDNNCLWSDAFYYTTATHTSIGFGDIVPKTKWLRTLTCIHMLFVFAFIILEL